MDNKLEFLLGNFDFEDDDGLFSDSDFMIQSSDDDEVFYGSNGSSTQIKMEIKLKDRGKMFVGGLSQATTTEGLKAYFSRFGEVLNAVVVIFPDSKISRGYGFVTFAHPSSLDIALTMGPHRLDGRNVDIRAFESKSERKSQKREESLLYLGGISLETKDWRNASKSQNSEDWRLFLGGIPFDVEEADLRTLFSKYGKVKNVIIPHGWKTNRPKAYAFLDFEEREAAEKCLSDKFVHLGNKRVTIRKAIPKNGPRGSASDLDEGMDCSERAVASAAGCGDDVASLDEDSQSSASGDFTSLLEQYPEFLYVFDNYFLSRMALCRPTKQTEAIEEDTKWEPPEEEIRKIERQLAKFLNISGGGDLFSDENGEESVSPTQEQKNPSGEVNGNNNDPKQILKLKVHALAKGMVCIQPLSLQELKCRTCDELIPKAPDFDALMKNVSSHLQSEPHLYTLDSPFVNAKPGNQKSVTTGKNMPKGIVPKTSFLCLVCNCYVNRRETLNAHINSKLHWDKKMKGKPADVETDYVLCKGCNRYLYGSLYDIDRHHAKCWVRN